MSHRKCKTLAIRSASSRLASVNCLRISDAQLAECSAVDRLAKLVAAHGAAGMRAQKRVVRTGKTPQLDAAMRHSIAIFGVPFETTEPAEAMLAFLKKRRHGRWPAGPWIRIARRF